jgi:hypothetical protein
MVFFIVQQHHDYTIANFLQSWARPLLGKVAILSWQDCARLGRLHRGTYVFGDYERMNLPQWTLARELASQLSRHGCRVVNHPDRVLDRLSMLRTLHHRGINAFNAYSADAHDLSAVRFPCFVRERSAHMGKMSGLLHTRQEMLAEIRKRHSAGESDLIVIEYLDTSNTIEPGSQLGVRPTNPNHREGGAASREEHLHVAGGPRRVYRKFGMFRCGEHMIARHIYFSRHWLQAATDIVHDGTVAEETDYIDGRHHAEKVREAFDLAGVEFGRADFAVLPDGRVQVWEINTNPMILAAAHQFDSRRLPAQARSAAATARAIEEIDDGRAFAPEKKESWMRVEIPRTLRAALGIGATENALQVLGRALNLIGRTPGVREFVRVCRRAHAMATPNPAPLDRAA